MGLKARRQPTSRRFYQTTEFANVDLDLVSEVDPARLIAALGAVHAIHRTNEAPYVAILALDAVGLSMEGTVAGFVEAVERLGKEERAEWDACSSRCFNIGIQSGAGPDRTLYELPRALVERVAAIGVSIVVTVYGSSRRIVRELVEP